MVARAAAGGGAGARRAGGGEGALRAGAGAGALGAGVLCAALAIGCGAPPVTATQPEPAPLTEGPAAADPASSEAGAAKDAFAKMLARVSRTRGLAVLGDVKLRTLDRATIGDMIRAKAARELPPDVLVHEADALVALGLVPPSYDA